MMESYEVSSSMLDSPIKYEAENESLIITFIGSGETWEYMGVTVDVWEEMKASPSVGKFFHARIKRVYSARRIA